MTTNPILHALVMHICDDIDAIGDVMNSSPKQEKMVALETLERHVRTVVVRVHEQPEKK
jgi:hypothetical protein